MSCLSETPVPLTSSLSYIHHSGIIPPNSPSPRSTLECTNGGEGVTDLHDDFINSAFLDVKQLVPSLLTYETQQISQPSNNNNDVYNLLVVTGFDSD